jgi:SAM-dependent methyltransferase
VAHPERDYGSALARIHDDGFGFHARAAADELLARLARAGHRAGLVVDLGCGSGLLARRMLAAGYEVMGVDQSPAMVALARRRAPEARIERASFVDVEIPPCVAVTAVGEVLGYAFDGRAGRGALRALFARARRALVPGGLLLFDLAGPGRGPATRPRRTWREGDGWTVCLETLERPAEGTLTRRHVLYVRRGAGWRRGDEVHVLNLHDPRAVLEDLAAAGFRARVLRRYGELRFPRGLAGFAATPSADAGGARGARGGGASGARAAGSGAPRPTGSP